MVLVFVKEVCQDGVHLQVDSSFCVQNPLLLTHLIIVRRHTLHSLSVERFASTLVGK